MSSRAERTEKLKKELTTWDLRLIHLVAGVTFAFAGGMFMMVGFDFIQPIQQTGLYLSNPYSYATAKSRVVTEVSINSLVITYFFIAAAHHLTLLLPLFFPIYIRCIKHRHNPFRFCEFALTGSLMAVIIGLVLGINELSTCILLFCAIATCNAIGWVAEIVEARLIVHAIAWIPFTAVWTVLYLQYSAAALSPFPVFSGYIHALFWMQLAIFTLFGVIQLVSMRYTNYKIAEYAFTVSSVTSKVIMGGLLFYSTIGL